MNNDLHSYNLSKYPLFLCYQCTFYKLKRSQQRPLIKLRGMGSNHRPPQADLSLTNYLFKSNCFLIYSRPCPDFNFFSRKRASSFV